MFEPSIAEIEVSIYLNVFMYLLQILQKRRVENTFYQKRTTLKNSQDYGWAYLLANVSLLLFHILSCPFRECSGNKFKYFSARANVHNLTKQFGHARERSESEKAIKFCEENSIDVVYGICVMIERAKRSTSK
jgi:hypothetical protein